MNPDHVRFAEWDAAYVLGALGSDDRRAYELHLQECAECRAAVAELASMTGPLGRVDPVRAGALLRSDEAPVPPAGPDAGSRARIVALGTRESGRRRRLAWSGAIAAAVALLVVVSLAVAGIVGPAIRPTQVVALQPVADMPITATVALADVAWGTRIEMTCRYGRAAGGDAGETWPYVLVAVSADGDERELSSWRGIPGTTARLTVGTAWDSADISAIEIRAVADDRVLMRAELGPPVSP